jgi:hypothetical protein
MQAEPRGTDHRTARSRHALEPLDSCQESTEQFEAYDYSKVLGTVRALLLVVL